MKTYQDLIKVIERTSEEGITLEEAERVAALCLGVMHKLSGQLKLKDKEARMRKAGSKEIKATVRLELVKISEKKPTESMLDAMVDDSELVKDEVEAFDSAEVDRDELERQYNIAQEAHIYYRGVSKGRFEV